MQTKTTNKLFAVALSLIMLLTLIPFSPMTVDAKADAASYVLEASSLTAAAAGTFKDGDTAKAGTDGYFTLIYSAKTKIDSSSKTWDDGYKSAQRVNLGGKVTTEKNAIKFTTANPATVKVWFAEGGDDNRQVAIIDASGNQVAVTKGTYTKNTAYLETLKVPAAGTYFLGGDINNNYFFKVEVTEEAAAKEYVLDAATVAEGDYSGKNGVKAGTDNFFTVNYGAKGKVDTTSTGFDDGYNPGKRFNFGGKTTAGSGERDITFKTSGEAQVKVWWVSGGDGRELAIYDAGNAKEVEKTSVGAKKNAAYISNFSLKAGGTYSVINPDGTNYLMKVQVTEGGAAPVERADWAKVAAPTISSVALDSADNGTIKVTAKAVVGAAGGDAVTVTMYDSKMNEVDSRNSIAEKDTHELTFTPSASDTYTFKAVLKREGETDKASTNSLFTFTLPLGKPTIVSATSKGNGTMEIVWQPVDEATGYKVYADGKEIGTSATTKLMASGLTVGSKVKFTVAATRGTEVGAQGEAVTATVTKDAQQTWGFIRYGTSTDDKNNGYVGSVNEDGKVTVFSENGKGKVQQASNDGLAFYYTAVPANKNFTLRAKVHVDSWKYSNGQDGFGLLVMDSVPEVASTAPFWTNDYMLAATLMKYKWDPEYKEVTATGTSSYTMKLGLGVNQKIGVTPANVSAITAGTDAELIKAVCGEQYPLDITLATSGKAAGTYNTIGNETSGKAPESAYLLTDFDLEIQKNNTGYFLTYYKNGKVVKTQKFYDPDALEVMDKDNVYVGFFAARNARATFSDVQLTTIDPKDDKPAEAKPKDKVRTNVVVKSGNVSNNENYTVTISANVLGTAEVFVNGASAGTFDVKQANEYTSKTVKLADGSNKVSVKFTPDAKQNLGADKELASTNAITVDFDVAYNNYFAEQNNIYVSPKGNKYGNGGKQYPLDVATAVAVAQPGQTIIMMEGTYKLSSNLTVNRGIDGTKDKTIKMIADPEAKTRPVLDFQKKGYFITAGDYWYFQGFDVTNGADKQSGMMVSGSNCVVDNVNAYNNGGTGIAIRSLNNTSDPKSEWPANNLILNCTSYNNADNGYEDADGFSAKFTIAPGNVFDGCVAYCNADDGWDLYARVSSGPISSVTIQNSVAYKNGYLVDGTNAGNGNGFKLGGENLAGGHILKNSLAFENKANGITSNSCPDVKIYNCTSYKNQAANITLYTGVASLDTDFEVKGLISYKGGAADEIKAQGTQDKSKYDNATNYYDGKGVSDDWFKSLKFAGAVARKADNTIDMQGYLELTDKAAKDAGARMVLAPSASFTVTADTNLPNPQTGVGAIPVAAGALAAAGAAIFVISRKRNKK